MSAIKYKRIFDSLSGGSGSGSGNLLTGARATGTDTYSATLSPALTSYTTDSLVLINFANANTGASTLNLNGLGAKNIYKDVNKALGPGDLFGEMILAYDGTNFQIVQSGYVEPSTRTLNVYNYNNFS